MLIVSSHVLESCHRSKTRLQGGPDADERGNIVGIEEELHCVMAQIQKEDGEEKAKAVLFEVDSYEGTARQTGLRQRARLHSAKKAVIARGVPVLHPWRPEGRAGIMKQHRSLLKFRSG